MNKTQETQPEKVVDVIETWRRHGFVPPSETRLEHLMLNNLPYPGLDELTIFSKKGKEK